MTVDQPRSGPWLAFAFVLAPGVAAADEDRSLPDEANALTEGARQHFVVAFKAFDGHDYAKASKEFEAAYELDPLPFLLYSWAQAERIGGHCPKAVELYRKYIVAGTTTSQERVARGWIDACASEAPMPPPITPAEHEPSTAYVWYRDYVGDALAISGVIGLAVGVGYLDAASHTADHAKREMFLRDFHADLDDATGQRRVGVVALGVGATLVAGSIAVYVFHHRAREAAITSDGHTLSLAARF